MLGLYLLGLYLLGSEIPAGFSSVRAGLDGEDLADWIVGLIDQSSRLARETERDAGIRPPRRLECTILMTSICKPSAIGQQIRAGCG